MPRGIPKSKNPDLYQQAPSQVTTSRDLSRKDRELQEWEDSLAKRQELYDGATGGAEHKLKLLESKIASKEEDLVRLERKLNDKTTGSTTETERLNKVTATARERKDAAQASVTRATEDLSILTTKTVTAQKRLKEVEDEVKARKVYLMEQEELIEKSANEGNNKLQDIGREYKKFELEREELLAKLHTDTTAVARLQSQIEEKEEDMTRLKLRYEDAASEYRQSLTALKLEIAQAQSTLKKTNAETGGKLLELKAERAEIEVAREVVAKQREEVTSEKRRLESLKVMYGM